MFFVLELECDNGSTLAVVADRPEDFPGQLLGSAGLECLRLIEGLAPGYTLGEALRMALQRTDAPLVAVLANPSIVMDSEMPARLARAAEDVTDPGAIGLLTAKGTDRWGNVFSALYASLEPQLPFCRTPVPVLDSASDLFMISRTLLDRLLRRGALPPMESLAGWAVLEGYLEGMVSCHSPRLAAGIYGRHLARNPEAHADRLCALIGDRIIQTSIPSLEGVMRLGSVPGPGRDAREWHLTPRTDLDRRIAQAIQPHCTRLRLSIVTRTQFSRPHLLRRLLTSLTRWRSDEIDLEVVLSTDIDRNRAEQDMAALRIDFPALTLVLAWNGTRSECSRVRNLLGGVATASGAYVAFVDDDDHVHFKAFAALSTIRFQGAMPVVVMDTELVKERWVQAAGGRWVLESAVAHHRYPASGWRAMFGGVNQLPISAAILPRDWLAETIERFKFRHDYSEDFTLFLLLLQAPDLPLVLTVPHPFSVVSVRDDGSNTVTEEDRSRWVRDITLFLHDLHVLSPLNGEGRLQAAVQSNSIGAESARPPLPVLVDGRLRRELAVARAENEALRARLVDLDNSAEAVAQTAPAAS